MNKQSKDVTIMLKNKKLIIGAISAIAALTFISTGCSSQNNQAANQSQGTQAQQDAKFTELEEKYQRLEDIEQIKQLKARYFRFIDEKKFTEFGELFASDAQIIFPGGQDFSKEGGAAFGKMLDKLVGKAPTVHHGFMPEIEMIDKDHAKGVWAMEDLFTVPDAKDAMPGHHWYGQYHETYKKENGVWKISSTSLHTFRMDPLKNWDPNTDPVTGLPVTGK